MIELSAILIVKNESADIERCLNSLLNFADEIIILDSGSTDNTIEICQNYTQHIFITDWPGFGPQKNRALEKASGKWVLSIDADEWVPEALKKEIQDIIQKNNSYSAFSIPRISYYCGCLIRHGDWRNDRPVRLFERGKAKFSNDLVHESLQVEGKIGGLKQKLKHNAFRSSEEVLEKMNLYSTLWAKNRFKKGVKASLIQALTHSLWTFIRGYFLRAGFLDGKAGFMLAISNAQGCYFRYIKLMQLYDEIS